MRVFAAGLATETNSFCPIPTVAADFRDNLFEGFVGKQGPVDTWQSMATARGIEFHRAPNLWAMPAGPVIQADYERLRDALVARVREEGPFEIILLNLHGAMLATGCDDCEGDLLRHMRTAAPAAVIAVELDLHANVTESMVAQADLIIAYKEWPHDDQAERATELFELALRTAEGTLNPEMALAVVGALLFIPTKEEPGRKIVEHLRAAERIPGVLSTSLCHGFGWSDTPGLGTKVITIAAGDATLAKDTAGQIADVVFTKRDRFRIGVDAVPPAAALDMVLQSDAKTILCEFGDIVTGGAPGDATHLLQEMVERRVSGACYAPLWDQVAAGLCAAAGPGERLALRLGGKTSRLSGDPMDVEADIVEVKHDYSHRLSPRFGFRAGTVAHIRIAEVDVLVSSERFPLLYPGIFADFGIDLNAKRIIAIKALQMARIHFAPVTDKFVMVSTPAAAGDRFDLLPYRRFGRDVWPFEQQLEATP